MPIAGYVPDRAAIKYLKAQRNMEVWFAPILGTRVLMPFKVVIPTPIGTGVMQATRFTNSLPPGRPTRAAPRGPERRAWLAPITVAQESG